MSEIKYIDGVRQDKMDTIHLQGNDLARNTDDPMVKIHMGEERYSPALKGWEIRLYGSSQMFWAELYDAEGNMHGGVTIDLFYMSEECGMYGSNESYPNQWALGKPRFAIDSASYGDSIVLVTQDPVFGDDMEDNLPHITIDGDYIDGSK